MDDGLKRREFFKSIVRKGLALGLIGMCAALFRRGTVDYDSAYAAPCRYCPIAPGCPISRTQDKTQ